MSVTCYLVKFQFYISILLNLSMKNKHCVSALLPRVKQATLYIKHITILNDKFHFLWYFDPIYLITSDRKITAFKLDWLLYEMELWLICFLLLFSCISLIEWKDLFRYLVNYFLKNDIRYHCIKNLTFIWNSWFHYWIEVLII